MCSLIRKHTLRKQRLKGVMQVTVNIEGKQKLEQSGKAMNVRIESKTKEIEKEV